MRGVTESVGAVLLLLCIGAVSAQVAPGDESQRCLDRADPTPSNMKMLMSSWHYDYLLASNGVWKERDYDSNNHALDFFATKWVQTVGGLCRWNVKSCGTLWGSQSNWLFTQFINKMVPPGTDYPVNTYVKISYSITSCRERLGCFSRIRLHAYTTNGPLSSEGFSNKDNYELVGSASNVGTGLKTLVANIETPTNFAGMYLAVEDNSSCIQISKLEVYRYQCPQKQEGLVIFPETAAPIDDEMDVTTTCMPHSSHTSSAVVTCTSEGDWTGSSNCRCDAGYYRTTDNGVDSCKPCRKGTYRSTSDPEHVCLPCPANTKTEEDAASVCQCLPDYFRNTEGLRDSCPSNQRAELPHDACTKPPSAPTGLVKSASSATSLTFRWRAPSLLGGRSDLYYRVHISDPDNVGVMNEVNCGSTCYKGTTCSVSGLRPATRYLVRVSTHNGVSDQDMNTATTREEEVTMETDVAPPSAPRNVRAFCEIVVWEPPQFTSGIVQNYVIRIGTSQHIVPGTSTSFVYPNALTSATLIRIAAINVAGTGPSALVTISGEQCGSNPTPTTTTVTITPSTVISTSFVPTVTTLTTTSTTTITTTASSCTPNPTPVSPPGIIVDITVLGRCSLAWKPPADIGGERPGYVVRFFDGTNYDVSSYREIFRTFEDPDKLFSTTDGCPTDRPVYADIRAKNSAGVSIYSEKVKVFDPADASSCPACDSCCTDCPTSAPCPTCPPPATCPTCPPSPTCPTVSCPVCPAPTECPPRDCPTTGATPEVPTLPACSSSDRTAPGGITGLVKVNCTTFKWDVATVAGCTDPDMSYRIRLFNGFNYESSPSRAIYSSFTNSFTFPLAEVRFTPVKAVVKARRGNAVFSNSWSSVITIKDNSC